MEYSLDLTHLNLPEIIGSSWLIGLTFSLVGGGLASGLTTHLWRKGKNIPSNSTPTVFMGLIERLFFTFGIAFGLSGMAPAMVAFIAAKMVAGWNTYGANKKDGGGAEKPKDDAEKEKDAVDSAPVKQLRMSALAGGIISILFATIGGLICAGRIVF